jgi:hypothetical protein
MKDFFSNRAHEDWDENNRHRPYWRQVFTHFAALEGMELEYYGADAASHEFKLDNIIFKVLEDPDDGYRSHLGVIEYGNQSGSIFFRTALGKIRIEPYNEETKDAEAWSSEQRQGYRFVDVDDGHVWLRFGTDNTDDYYPYFVFRHMPKDQEIEV